jgi:hypothetical protein
VFLFLILCCLPALGVNSGLHANYEFSNSWKKIAAALKKIVLKKIENEGNRKAYFLNFLSTKLLGTLQASVCEATSSIA